MELTEEEKAEARQEAIKQYQREELAKLQSRKRTSEKDREHSNPSTTITI